MVGASLLSVSASTGEARAFSTVGIRGVGGEPAVVFNPRRPREIVFMTKSGIAVSFDAGRRWTTVAPGVADPQLVADSTGRIYAPAPSDASESDWLGPGALIQTSTDGGLSWARPVQAFPHVGIAEASDRLWLAVDQQTNTVYATVARHRVPPGWGRTPSREVFAPSTSSPVLDNVTCEANALNNPLTDCGDRIVAATHDGGRTWSAEQPMDSPDYPNSLTGGFNAIPVAANGYLATVYYASSAPGGGCPCVVFETSRDDGRHWNRHVVPGAKPQVHGGVESVQANGLGALLIGDGQSAVFGPYPAADPAHPGHFAFLEGTADHTGLLVYETSDFGRSWTRPVRIGQRNADVKERPWLAFSPHGALAAYWRDDHASDQTFDPWVAVSPSGGAEGFGSPVRIDSHRTAISETSDDNSDAKIDDHFVYVTWGDSRSGETQGWFGSYRYR
jgi:hypothetical protein